MRNALKFTAGAATAAFAVILALTVPPRDASAQSSGAQSSGAQARGMAACRADAASFCKGIEPGRGARTTCLAAVKDKLTPDCAAALEARLSTRDTRRAMGQSATLPPGAAAAPEPEPVQPGTPRAMQPPSQGDRPALAARPARGPEGRPMAACRGDMQTFCASVQPGGGARIRCLAENQAKLSPACAEAYTAKSEARKAQRAEMRGACKADAQSLCRDAKGPDRRQCLAANVDKLNPDCAAALKGPRG